MKIVRATAVIGGSWRLRVVNTHTTPATGKTVRYSQRGLAEGEPPGEYASPVEGVGAEIHVTRRPRGDVASWPDWLVHSIDAAPGPAWLAYLAIFALLGVIAHAARWLGGTLQPGLVDPLGLLEASFPVLFLAILAVLNVIALSSLQTLRPALIVDDVTVQQLSRDLIRTPRWAAVFAGVAGLAFTAVSIASGPEGYGLRPGVGPEMWLWEFALGSATSAVAFAVVLHAVHQVRLVARVHRQMVRVDLFRLDPLYGFASLTSWTGILLVALGVYGFGSLAVVGGVRFSAVDYAIFGVIVLVSAGIFVI